MLATEYIAGFFDGEGSVGIYKTASFMLRVCIVQVRSTASTRIFDDLIARFGGDVYQIGKMKSHHRTADMWAIYGNKASLFLTTIRPFLLLKGEQADLAIRWQTERDTQPKARSSAGKNARIGLRSGDAEVAQKLKNMKRAP